MSFTEMPDSPIAEYGRKTATVTRKWIGPWADRGTFSVPSSYTLGTYDLYVNTKCVTGRGQCTQDQEGNNVFVLALIEVTYTPLDGGGRLQAAAVGLGVEWELARNYKVDHLTIPRRKLLWWDDDTSVDKDMIRLEGTTEIVLTRHNCHPDDFPNFEAYEGCINNATFLGYAAGHVLFLGATTRETITEAGDASGEYTLTFAVKRYDWRDAWRDSIAAYVRVYAGTHQNPQYIYEEATLSALIE